MKNQAARWLVRTRLGSASQQEKAEFDAWLAADKQHEQAWSQANQAWRDMADMGRQPEYADLLGEPTFQEKLQAFKLRVGEVLRPVVVPVTIALVGAVAIATLFRMSQPGTLPLQAYETGIAQIQDITLRDGSIVTLGAHSKLAIGYGDSERFVRLDSGEAFFSVAKDTDRPFTVAVDGTRIRVLGTEFEVRQGPKNIRIAVLEGAVEVARSVNNEKPEAAQKIKHQLTAGQQIVTTHDGSLSAVKSVGMVEPGAWRKGRLVYEDANLLDVVADVNRYYDGQIQLASPDLAELKVTTSFRAGQIEPMLETLTLALSLQVQQLPDGGIILKEAQ